MKTRTMKVPAFIQDPNCTAAQIKAGNAQWIPFAEVRANRSLAIRVIDVELAKLLTEHRRICQLAKALDVPERISDVLNLSERIHRIGPQTMRRIEPQTMRRIGPMTAFRERPGRR